MTETNILWRHYKSLPNVPSPLLYRNVLYLMKEGGILTALDPATGRVLKQGRLKGALDFYYSSPVGADGKIFTASQEGHVSVIRAGADWEVLAVNDMDDEVYATPAPVDGRLYLRTRSALYCFGEPAR
jgi:outer membrane protein assembly factor BamB